MRKGSVRLRHPVRIFAALDGRTLVVGGVHQFGGEAVGHALASALARRQEQPAYGKRLAAVALDLYGHLVRRATYAAGLHLDDRSGVADRLLEHLDAGALGAPFKLVNRIVENALGQALLAALHQLVDELRHQHAVVARIGRRLKLFVSTSSGHSILLSSKFQVPSSTFVGSNLELGTWN